jgi:hypothetical protein
MHIVRRTQIEPRRAISKFALSIVGIAVTKWYLSQAKTKEPFLAAWHLLGMVSPTEAVKNTVDIGKKHILDQQLRIGRHRELMAKVEREGHLDVLAQLRRQLVEMEQTLAQMEAAYAGARPGRKRL